MVAILTAIMGVIGGVVPEIVKIFKAKQDQQHELEVMKLQIEATRLAGMQRLDEILIQRDISEAEAAYRFAAPPQESKVPIIDAIVYLLNGLVRPLWAYAMFGFYVVLKISFFMVWRSSAANDWQVITMLWSEFDQGLMAGIGAFYFTNRAMRYAMGQLKMNGGK
jgi:hypothetical protein